MAKNVIAIDGPAASGKSTVARAVAQRLGFLFVSSGHYYRAVAWAALQSGAGQPGLPDPAKWEANPETLKAIASWLTHLSLQSTIVGEDVQLRVSGQDPSAHLADPVVNASVSQLAALPPVRAFLLGALRQLATEHDLVMEGRDIGSVVFPETPYKFYLDASPEERARRRSQEGSIDAIAERDQRDSSRAISPLKVAAGADIIDTTHLSITEVVEEILRRVPGIR